MTTEISKRAFKVFTKMCNYTYNILYRYLHIIKLFNSRFINYLGDEHLHLFCFPTSLFGKQIYYKLHLLLCY